MLLKHFFFQEISHFQEVCIAITHLNILILALASKDDENKAFSWLKLIETEAVTAYNSTE